MRPVTDKYKVSRAKLAYIIDATAAPVCIIAPISSWAAAVGSSLPDDCAIDGFSLFLKTIPFNLYAILTIVFMIILIGKNFDYGAMAKYHADLIGKKEETADGEEEIKIIGNGKVIDLILPIIVLIVLCISAMLYTGGILDGAGVATAFADCDSSRVWYWDPSLHWYLSSSSICFGRSLPSVSFAKALYRDSKP